MTEKITWHVFAQWEPNTRQEYLAEVGKNILAETAVFQQTSDMLAYHNQLDDLIHLLKIGYTQLKSDNKTHEWQQQTVTSLLMDSLIFQFLAHNPPDNAIPPESLAKALQAIVPIEVDGLNSYLAHLNGYTQYQWQLDHLAEYPPQNMAALMIEFLAFAQHEADVPYGRTNLLRQLLPTYFVERRTGQLNPRQDLGDLMRRGRTIPKPPANPHPLTPDSDTLQRFLAKLLNYDPVRPYPTAALFTLSPVWLNFLQARRLLDATTAKLALDDLANLQADLLAYFQSQTKDETLVTAVSNWPNHPQTP